MAYNEHLADRMRLALKNKSVAFVEKKMMGGLTFMVNDKMCVGIIKDDMIARIDPEIYEASIAKPGCRAMDFTGRPMKGFVMIDPPGTDMDEDLEYWIGLALEFKPKASKRK